MPFSDASKYVSVNQFARKSVPVLLSQRRLPENNTNDFEMARQIFENIEKFK